MPNQYVNKVTVNGSTILDLTSDTVDAAHLLSGYTAHDASGAPIVGTASGGGVTQDQDGYLVLSDQGGGSSITVESLSVTQNGTYTAPTGKAYSPVTVSVSGGGSADLKAIIEGTAVTPTLPNDLTTIRDYAFYELSSLALTSLPSSVTSIGVSAFHNCTNLALTSLPSGVTYIDEYCFQGCTNLALTSLPSGVTDIGTYAFAGCTNLALTALPDTYFTIGTYAFINCTNMPLASLGALFSSNIPTSAFYGCKAITAIDCAGAKSIAATAFSGCNSLHTLVLRRTTLCTLSNVTAFSNTPLRGYNGLTGTVYVPSSLIASYKTASNWKTLYDAGTVAFVAIEGSEYES